MSDTPTERQGALVQFALIAGLVALKVQVNAGMTSFGTDGSLYLEVARNVRDGRGLVSFISLMNAGVESFPYPTPLYPIWPLLLGVVGRVVPIEVAAIWLPTLFYFGAVVQAARLARTLWPGPLFPDGWRPLDAGHVAILLLGYNSLFFEYTSVPYTEGLAWCGLFFLLLRARAFFGQPSALRAAEVGLYTGLLILVRSQMFLASLALGGTFAWALLTTRERGRWAGYAAAAAAGWGLALAPQLLYLSTFYHPLGLNALLRFDDFRASNLLTPLQTLRPAGGAFAWLLDRAEGFDVAYTVGGRYAYVQNFGVLHWAPPLAVLFGLRRWRDPTRAAWARLREPSAAFTTYLVLLALGGFASIHTLHKDFGAEWNFATRHALTVLFLFGWGVVSLAARGGAGRTAAVAILSITGWLQAMDLKALYKDTEASASSGIQRRAGLVWWIQQARRADPALLIVTDEPQRLAVLVPDLPVHSVWLRSSYDDLWTLFDHFGADYLIINDRIEKYDFANDPRWTEGFELVAPDISGEAVYRRRDLASSETEPVP